jgi:hypothetical protein
MQKEQIFKVLGTLLLIPIVSAVGLILGMIVNGIAASWIPIQAASLSGFSSRQLVRLCGMIIGLICFGIGTAITVNLYRDIRAGESLSWKSYLLRELAALLLGTFGVTTVYFHTF